MSDDAVSAIEEEARGLFRQGDYAAAVERIQAHLVSEGEDATVYELLATALKYSSDKAGAAGALMTAGEIYGREGMTIQSIGAQKKAMELGVEPDFSSCRPAGLPGPDRVPTPLFDDLSDDEFNEVAAGLVHRSYEPGDAVVTEGQPGDSMFVISSGEVGVYTLRGGSEVELANLRAGDFFGEAALLSGKPRTATIRASVATTCLELSRSALDEVILRCPRVEDVMKEFNVQRAHATIETLLGRQSD
ncbi:MAG: cyclic nucleotide-binding domain-containing protein [Acidobacteriota bacterium]